MSDLYFEDVAPDVRLREGLDVAELQAGEGQEFEVDPNDIDNYGNDGLSEQQTKAYECYRRDFCGDDAGSDDEEEEDEENGKNSLTQFDRLAAKMFNVTEDGGVKKQILLQGIGDVVPADASVTIHYNAYLEFADEPFDSTWMRGKPLHFNLGTGNVIAGLDVAVKSMRKLEKSRFLIHPDYGLGIHGCPPRVPGNATCLYVVELLNFSESGGVEAFYCKSREEQREAPFEDILKAVTDQRRQGRSGYEAKKYPQAVRFYRRAVQYLNEYHLKDEAEEREQQRQLVQLYQNLALCHLKLKNYQLTIANANSALQIDSNNAKPYYLKGKALRLLSHFDDAAKALRRAKFLKGSDTAISDELILLEKDRQRISSLERETCRRMFASASVADDCSRANDGNIPKSDGSRSGGSGNMGGNRSDPQDSEQIGNRGDAVDCNRNSSPGAGFDGAASATGRVAAADVPDASASEIASAAAALPAEESDGESFRDVIMTVLTQMKNDPESEKQTFSTNCVTLAELSIVEEVARQLGLFVTPRRCQDKSVFLQVLRDKPEM